MSELDNALELYIEDDNNRSSYFNLVLNSDFYIPVQAEEEKTGAQEISAQKSIVPLVFSADGADHLLLFDSKERLHSWDQEALDYVIIAGDEIAQMTPPQLHWALNLGTDFHKKFVPEEITWLQEIVQRVAELTDEDDGEENN